MGRCRTEEGSAMIKQFSLALNLTLKAAITRSFALLRRVCFCKSHSDKLID